MPDKNIGLLPAAPQIDADSLYVMEQQGTAMKVTGQQMADFQVADAKAYSEDAGKAAEEAAEHEQGAKEHLDAATKQAQDAAKSADTAKQYSGNPAIPGDNGNWMIWNADTGEYQDSGKRTLLNYDKSYPSIAEMNADAANQKPGTVAIISSDVNTEDNAKTYIKRDDGKWGFLVDLSGFPGVGIEKWEKTAGTGDPGTTDTYTVTLTDGRKETYTVYNGRDSKVVSVNGQTGDVQIDRVAEADHADAADELTNALTFEGSVTGTWNGSEPKTVRIPIINHWTVTIAPADWVAENHTFNGVTTDRSCTKACADVTADTDFTDCKLVSGDAASYLAWSSYVAVPGGAKFYAKGTPTATFTVQLEEAR